MKKTNKFLASTLALTMALTAAAPISAFAAEVKDGNTELSLDIPVEYYIEIPADNSNLKVGDEFEVSAHAYLCHGQELAVSVSSEQMWQLRDKVRVDNPETIAYKMVCDGRILEDDREEILKVVYDEDGYDKAVTLSVDEVSKSVFAGSYGDVLTFTTEVRDTVSVDEGDIADPFA